MVQVRLRSNQSLPSDWKSRIEERFTKEDYAGLRELACANAARVVRHLTGRLYSSDEREKWLAVRALGELAADPLLLPDDKLAEVLRRYFWSLNDESGAVPYGIPEAIGEILARRPAFRKNNFLPILWSMILDEEVVQTGAIERGVIWALGRVCAPAAECSPEGVAAVQRAAQNHPDPQTRAVATWALGRFPIREE